MSTLHAHIEYASRDCDGLYTGDYVQVMNDDEIAAEFGDLAFRDRVVGSLVSFTGLGGTLTVTVGEGWSRASWSEPTEEGYRNVEATFCEDECELGERSFRDHTAEAAGY